MTAVGAEVAVTVTGRITYTYPGGVVVEYLNGSGLLSRLVVDTATPAVTVAAAPEPTPAELDARVRAARLVVDACRDTDPPVVVLR